MLSAAPVSAHFDAEVRVSEVSGQSIAHRFEVDVQSWDPLWCGRCDELQQLHHKYCRLVIARRRSTARCCAANLLKSQSDVREFWTAVISGGQLWSSGCRCWIAKTNACCLGECMYRARTQWDMWTAVGGALPAVKDVRCRVQQPRYCLANPFDPSVVVEESEETLAVWYRQGSCWLTHEWNNVKAVTH